jgi:Fic family protein
VADALQSWEKYVNYADALPSLVRLALLHYQFEAIHPFLDGNGRVGRLLIALLLVHWELLPAPVLYVSDFFERNREEYYDRLLAVSQHGQWLEWIDFFLSGVVEQAERTIARLGRLQDLQAKWREDLTGAGGSAKLLKLADHLFERPIISIPDAQAVLEMTYRGAQLNVEKLVEANILAQTDDRAYNKLFAAEDIFRIILGNN